MLALDGMQPYPSDLIDALEQLVAEKSADNQAGIIDAAKRVRDVQLNLAKTVHNARIAAVAAYDFMHGITPSKREEAKEGLALVESLIKDNP